MVEVKPQEESVMKNTTIAIDLAKTVFEVGISNRPGHVSKTETLHRRDITRFMREQPPATVLMEACGSAHYWARQFEQFGHDVKLLPPLKVRPYVQRSKTDRNDVKGILEAWRNTDMRPVPIKTVDQQQLMMLHRVRTGWMETRTARINSARGALREFGIIFPLGAAALAGRVKEVIEDADQPLPPMVRSVLKELTLEIGELEARIETAEKQLKQLASQTPKVELLRTIPGIGLLTATALAGFVGTVERFPSGRHFAAYLGLTPLEHSSGGRRRLGHITKMGDVYLRTLLIHGARSVLVAAPRQTKPDRLRTWALELQRRIRQHNKAVVAIANKLARIVWAVWKSGTPFKSKLQATA
jgi:transposase